MTDRPGSPHHKWNAISQHHPRKRETVLLELRHLVEQIRKDRINGITDIPDGLDPMLSEKERLILQLVAYGVSQRDIADAIEINTESVKNIMVAIYRKMECHDRFEAVRRGVVLCLIDYP